MSAKPKRIRCLTVLIEAQTRLMNELNLFDIQHNTIFTWRGNGNPKDQKDKTVHGSFCQAIIAQELSTEVFWIVLVDPGGDSGTSISNSARWIILKACQQFGIDILNIRAFEIYPWEKGPSYAEIILGEYHFLEGCMKADISWQPCDTGVFGSLKKIVEIAGEGVVDHG